MLHVERLVGGGGPSIVAPITMPVVTVAAAALETTTRPPSSVGVDVTATTVTMAAGFADDARYDPAVNVNGGPSPAALMDNADNGGAVNTSVQVAVVSVILNAAKSSLRAYFEGVNWPLNKALPKGAKFLNGPLGDIMRQFCLVKMQVACQLLNYKKGRFMNTQVSILLNPSDLDERLREGMAMSTPEFVSLTLLRICYPDPSSSYGSDFCNLCAVISLSRPLRARTSGWLPTARTTIASVSLLVSLRAGYTICWRYFQKPQPGSLMLIWNLRGRRRQGCVPLPTSSLWNTTPPFCLV